MRTDGIDHQTAFIVNLSGILILAQKRQQDANSEIETLQDKEADIQYNNMIDANISAMFSISS